MSDERDAVFNPSLRHSAPFGEQSAIIVFNNDTKPATFSFNVREAEAMEGAILEDELGVVEGKLVVENGSVKITMPARSSSVFVYSDGFGFQMKTGVRGR